MTHRQHIKPGQRIIHDLSKPLADRLKSRQSCGPYYFTPPNAAQETRGFYLASDFMPHLRWQWSDNFTGNGRGRLGYLYNDFGDYISGIVFRLPKSRGFLAGWSMGEGMASELEVCIYPDEYEAAMAAESLAESAAEKQREFELEDQATIEAEELEIKALSDDEKTVIGEAWANILMLKKSREHKDRYLTTWGDKTALGLYNTVCRLVNDNETGLH